MRFLPAIAWAIAFTSSGLVAGDIWLDGQFGDAAAYEPAPKQDFVSGVIPKGWSDNAAWSKSNCKFSFEKEGELGFLRVAGENKGLIQFIRPFEQDIKEKSCFRLTFKARSSIGTAATFMMRDVGKPYEAHGLVNVPLDKEWKDYSVMISATPVALKQCLVVRSGSPGVLDIAALKMECVPLSEYVPFTTVPQQRDSGWVRHVAEQDAKASKAKPDFMILGDSITQGWTGAGKKVWDEDIAPLNAFCDGIGGDRVDNLLWRVRHMPGLGKDYSPKLIAILIGINNSWSAMPEDIAAGLGETLKELRAKTPSSKILIIGVFPTREKPDDQMRETVRKINALYSKFADNTNVFFYDFGDAFLSADGTISKDVMPDFLHPNESGYRIYSAKLVPKIEELLNRN